MNTKILALAAAAAAAAVVGPASAAKGATLPPNWHVHDCTASPCVPPHAPTAFFPYIVGQTPAPSSEISTGIVQQPTATPVSASSPSWSPSPSEGAAIAIGALLAITAAGFAVRSRRTGGPTLAT